jgi:hypothetical protein
MKTKTKSAKRQTAVVPRFVWNIGAIQELYPDMPEQTSDCVLWDRQEKKTVALIGRDYAQAFCLETTSAGAHSMPFTNLERWFNALSNEDLASEGLTITNK